MLYVLCFGGITLLILLFIQLTDSKGIRLEQRLDDMSGYVPREAQLQEPFYKRVLFPAIALLAIWGGKMTPTQQRDRLIERLVQSGLYSPAMANSLLACKGFGVLLGFLLGWGLTLKNVGLGLTVGGLCAIGALYLPDLWLNQRILQRKEEITRSLPDVLDLVTASVEAGLSLDASILRITRQELNSHGALLSEFERYLADVRLGTGKSEALSDLGWRCGVEDLQSVVAALLQADTLGVGVGQALRIQSAHLRMKRRQRAQESALQAPVKMLFPLVFFVFPAIFIVTLGPAVLRVMDTFVKIPH
ncbi:MAG: type II secretion system F family protein [Bacteroidota bacterium]